MAGMMAWIADRLLEPSTWRGVVVVLVAVGMVSDLEGEAILSAAMAALGLIEILRSERGR